MGGVRQRLQTWAINATWCERALGTHNVPSTLMKAVRVPNFRRRLRARMGDARAAQLAVATPRPQSSSSFYLQAISCETLDREKERESGSVPLAAVGCAVRWRWRTSRR